VAPENVVGIALGEGATVLSLEDGEGAGVTGRGSALLQNSASNIFHQSFQKG